MQSILAGTFDELKGITNSVFRSFKYDLIFPPRLKTYEQYLRSRVKDQYSIIRDREGKISFLHGQLRELGYENQSLRRALIQKDKELESYRRQVRDLEMQLRESGSQ